MLFKNAQITVPKSQIKTEPSTVCTGLFRQCCDSLGYDRTLAQSHEDESEKWGSHFTLMSDLHAQRCVNLYSMTDSKYMYVHQPNMT